jgi:enediyne polyketide synthase
MSDPIAIVGMACRYPDAPDPDRLWELVLSQRRAFRPIPPGRLNATDYFAAEADDPDRTYVRFAAVLDGWEFDRARYRVPGPAYRVTDATHWLALDVAADTFAAAGFPDGRGLDPERTGVVIGNTLAGEFSRAALMRLRWPYVQRVLQQALAAEAPTKDLAPEAVNGFLTRIEQAYKAPFPVPTDESLAGGLANTIAGRICNHFDLHGGGYIVDGACSSSLLAIVTACSALRDGDVDLVLAGGVDLSLDPFELVGFARTGALATSAMRVYDAAPTGFWPGEGCGMVALMRADDALAAGRTPLALIRGWGISSDGRGGITRPETTGQLLALRRAYRRAGFDAGTVALFEGHGTGTAVGDQVEIRTLIEAQRGRRELPPAALGSIKANIGHTKAAAGIAGLLKATLALQRQVIPPTTGCDEPHELLHTPGTPLRVVPEAEPWPDAPLRAAVSAMGFGGINAHIVLESVAPRRRGVLSAVERRTARRPLSHETFVFGADSVTELGAALARTAEVADRMSFAEHTDLAAALAGSAAGDEPRRFRVALVATDPAQLGRRARQAVKDLGDLELALEGTVLVGPGRYASRGDAGRVGLLFTGQGAPIRTRSGALGSVFPEAGNQLLADQASAAAGPVVPAVDPADHAAVDTAVAQPATFRASLAGLHWLRRLGVEASGAVGHSLGEITALCWAGAFTETDALDLVTFRGRVMSELGTSGTGMASIAAPAEVVVRLIDGTDLVIAADNGAAQVVAGSRIGIERVLERARADGVDGRALAVSHAFHSRAVVAAEEPLADRLADMKVTPVERRVYSTVSGRLIAPADDLRHTLARQVTAPVLFRQAVQLLATSSALLVEVGPGAGLASLAAGITEVPAVALDVGTESAEGLCQVAAALYAAGAVTDLGPMFAERFHRPFDLWRDPQFLQNPCESAPNVPTLPRTPDIERTAKAAPTPSVPTAESVDAADNVAAVVRQVLADALELAPDAVRDDDRLLSDLHLNSLRVAQVAAQAATTCGRALPAAPLSFADVPVADLVTTIETLPLTAEPGPNSGDAVLVPPGVSDWHRVLVAGTEPIDVPGDEQPNAWRVHGRGPLRAAVEPLLRTSPVAAPAVVLFLPEDPGEQDIAALVDVSRAATTAGIPLTVVDHGDSASGFLGTIRQEHPDQLVRWVSARSPAAAATVARILQAPATDQAEIVVDEAGRAAAPVYRTQPLTDPVGAGALPLGAADVVLITGGGKGIGFETALALAGRCGARLALVGRSDPDRDDELRANLARLREIGAAFRYEAADVTDAASVRRAIAELTRGLGPVTALVHSSGVNRPRQFAALNAGDYAEHAAPKCDGLRTVVDAIDASRLRVLVTYGSVIGRFGLPGEAHYALANGRMREIVRGLARDLPECWVCNLDWTAWSGAGMGERLDVLDSLVRSGVVPLPAQRGIELLLALLATRPPAASVIVSGRLPTLDRAAWTPAGRYRFAERVPTHTPGVELIAEAELSASTDVFLTDHRIDGLRVLPAVYALEAMAQAAHVLTGRRPAEIADARFDRPVIVPEEGTRTIRLCALVRDDGDVDVVLRSDETGFTVDHFAGRVAAGTADPPDVAPRQSRLPGHDGAQLYGPLFFHGPLFRWLRRYDHLEATGCTAVLSGTPLPVEALLGDPARNDATIHVLQACVPHRRLLPVGCARFSLHESPAQGATADELVLAAVERAHTGSDYTYDILVRDSAGRSVVSWAGLRLRDVGPITTVGRWPKLLLGPYLQRGTNALVPDAEVRLNVVASAPGGRSPGRGCATGPDGWSRSHLDGMVLTASALAPVSCDWEWVPGPGELEDMRRVTPWSAQVDQLMRLTGEPEGQVRTRLWAVNECLCKAGRTTHAPLTVRGAYEQGWVLLRAGQDDVVSAVLHIDGDTQPVAVAVLVRRES